MKRSNLVGLLLALLVVVIGAIIIVERSSTPNGANVVRIGITPYQDSALPIVAEQKGWYKQDGLTVRLVPLSWDQVVPALSSGAIDVAVYNINSFLPAYNNAAVRKPTPIFYVPLYAFKGQAIMVHSSAHLATITGGVSNQDISRIVSQLRGKRIAVTKGTELEQIVLAALTKAGLKPSDVQIIHASPEDCLAAFLANNVDAFAAGLTERVEARRHGGVELLTESDVMRPVIDGYITTDNFAKNNKIALSILVNDWFKTVRYIGSDVSKNSQEIRDYLQHSASTRYTAEEYAIAWTFDIFPEDASAADQMFNREPSPYFWKSSWDDVNRFLLAQKQIVAEPPYSAYWGKQTLSELVAADRGH